jgi:hypothetical protein
MVPFVADNIPVHHWTLRDGRAVGIRHRMACVIKIGAPNRDYGAKNNADKDTHDENSLFPISNAADNAEFPTVRRAGRAIVTAKEAQFAARAVNLIPLHVAL